MNTKQLRGLIILLILLTTSTTSTNVVAQEEGDPKKKLEINIDQETYTPDTTSLIVISGNSNDTGYITISYANETVFRVEFANLSITPTQIVYDIPIDKANGTYTVFATYDQSPTINVTKSFDVVNHNYYVEPVFKYRWLDLNVTVRKPTGGLIGDYSANITNMFTTDSILLEDVVQFARLTVDISEDRLLYVPGQAISVSIETNDKRWAGNIIFSATLDINQVEIEVHRTPQEVDRIWGLIAIPALIIVVVVILIKQKYYGSNKFKRLYSGNKNEINFLDDEDPI